MDRIEVRQHQQALAAIRCDASGPDRIAEPRGSGDAVDNQSLGATGLFDQRTETIDRLAVLRRRLDLDPGFELIEKVIDGRMHGSLGQSGYLEII
jgi:hypothetical protein